jgi:hypothetical protein
MEKKSSIQEKRLKNIFTVMNNENISQKELAHDIDMLPQNFNRALKKISDKLCIKINEAYPQYRLDWIMGKDDYMTEEEYVKHISKESDIINNSYIIVLESALSEACYRENRKKMSLDNIPELLLLEAQLKDYAVSLMSNYVIHRKESHVWSFLDNIKR